MGTSYAPWHLPLQKANCLLALIGDTAPQEARAALEEPLGAMDLGKFVATLRAIERVARAIVRAREMIPCLREVNESLASSLERNLEPGQLEDYDRRQNFLRVVGVAWSARRGQLGGLFESEMKAKDLFLVG